MDIRSLLQTHWELSPSQVVLITEGLINQTWLVRNTTADFILQEINTAVFQAPFVLQAQLVTLSLSIQLPDLVPLQYISTKEVQLALQIFSPGGGAALAASAAGGAGAASCCSWLRPAGLHRRHPGCCWWCC
jgi:hypothetical protein